jgi:transposase
MKSWLGASNVFENVIVAVPVIVPPLRKRTGFDIVTFVLQTTGESITISRHAASACQAVSNVLRFVVALELVAYGLTIGFQLVP